jgi:hypothetical protein
VVRTTARDEKMLTVRIEQDGIISNRGWLDRDGLCMSGGD